MKSAPQIMAILNLTPDSFYDGGKNNSIQQALKKAEDYLDEGANIIDIGAYSSRPGAKHISEDEELSRLMPVLKLLVKEYPSVVFSIDTFRSNVAKQAVSEGAKIINDISGGTMDNDMLKTIASLPAKYILMHMEGTPQTMQQSIIEDDIVIRVYHFFEKQLDTLKNYGFDDVILDVGFGFGKTLDQNYILLKNLSRFEALKRPLLVGLSRKSMLYKLLNISPEQALNATTVAHTMAILNGANYLRVHDVKACRETIEVVNHYKNI